MNLHGIVSGAISAVNPFVTCQLQASTGDTAQADGSRTPGYAPAVPVSCQIQPLQYRDITLMDDQNISGTRKKIYIKGTWDGVSRPKSKGGDLVTFPDGSVYLVALVSEQWPDWAALLCTLQNGS